MTDDLLQAVDETCRMCTVSACAGSIGLQRSAETDETRVHRRRLSRDVRSHPQTLPTAAVSSDFIVGFCGETEEAHQKSLDLMANALENSLVGSGQ